MHELIAQNLARVRERIEAACDRSGRDPGTVTLVAVTKTVGVEAVRALYAAGARHFGENRVPDGLDKTAALHDLDCTWHFIGHLQRNKAARALEGFRLFHGLESEKLAEVLQQHATRLDQTVDVFLEVNVAGEANKYGVAPERAGALLAHVRTCDRLRIRGLMTMAPFTHDPESVRPVFAGLRECAERLREQTGCPLPDLSMGMSNDFEIAVEEGATLVRVGSALFDPE